MGTPLQVERPFPSLSTYSLNDTHISASQSPTPFYDPINAINERLYTSEHLTPHISFPSYTNPPRVRTNTDTSTSKQNNGMGMMNASLGTDDNMPGGSGTMKRTNKTHVPSACVNCKRAHLACDVSRPCKRCVALGKVDTCIDIKHKKRGRPKLKDKKPHPYNTHATADAKTWVQSPQFLPPTTANPNPQSLHQQSDQHPPPPNTYLQTHSSSRQHHLHNNHRRHNHHSTSYISKSPQPTSISRQHPQQENSPTITMFLTIDGMACARVSNECLGTIGYYPSELVHKSLYNYVHAQDTDKLQKLISSLLENANRYCQNHYQPLSSDPLTTEDPIFSQSPDILQYPAYGGPIFEVSDFIHLKQRIGQYDLYDVKMYLGGGLLADLTRKETWNKMYIVALFTRVNVQSRMNGNSIVGGFSTQITSPPTTTIDPALLTVHNNNSNIGSPNSNLGIGRSNLLSPEIGPTTSIYSEINHSNFRKPLQPYNSHETFTSSMSSIVSRSSPVTRSEHNFISSSSIPNCSLSGSQSLYSFERRNSSAFNAIRSPSDGNLSLHSSFYNEIVENKPLELSSYTNQSNRYHNNNNTDNVYDHSHQHHHHHHHDETNDSFPTFRSDERPVEELMIPTIPRKSSSRVGTVGDDSVSTTRMSVNSLLCSN